MEIVFAHPAKGNFLMKNTALLESLGLRWDQGCESTVALVDDGTVIATGSRQGSVLKCIGVSPDRQSWGLTATLVTELIKDARQHGRQHLFLFTKPENLPVFRELGFYPVIVTEDVAMLENVRNGIESFVNGLEQPSPAGINGAIVANCNPFTNGHLYLVEFAAQRCDYLHLFILSEDLSAFPASVRVRLAQDSTAHIPNVIVHPTGPYLISAATFPDYFIKNQAKAKEINCELDLMIFAERFAKPMGITRRFVGTEPACPVTSAYNRQMRMILPRFGIEVTEIPRCENEGVAISASRVRSLMEEKNLRAIRPMVPPPTYAYLKENCSHAL